MSLLLDSPTRRDETSQPGAVVGPERVVLLSLHTARASSRTISLPSARTVRTTSRVAQVAMVHAGRSHERAVVRPRAIDDGVCASNRLDVAT